MHQLTSDQEAAVAAFTGFILTPETEFTISGGAGVGKTTLLKHLMGLDDVKKIAEILGRKPITKVALTATTNKAAEVLQLATGMEAQTIHSYLGLRVKPDFTTGRTNITKSPNHTVKEDTLIFVDECSMIDRDLRRHIHDSTLNCKIVYVGDHCQLAPITEAISPVFSAVEPVVLNTIIRSQNAPDITQLCLQLRQTVETGVFQEIQEVPGVIDYLSPEQAEQEIQQNFVQRDMNARILCYTNAKVVGFNNWIRNARNLPPELQPGEQVVACNAAEIAGTNRRLRVEQELTISQVNGPFDHQNITGKRIETIHYHEVVTNAGAIWVPSDTDRYFMLTQALKKEKNWALYYELQETFADLRPIHAATVYKAQGSTYHTVYVDLADIGRCNNPSQAARLLYVACSRPTNRICFIGNLPGRFRGG